MKLKLKPLVLLLLGLAPAIALASSHREAPFISSMPQVDGSDFYMFMSYEAGHAGYVTLLANYNPLQDPTGGPNFLAMSGNAVYDIGIDNNGDGAPDLTYRFNFTNTAKNLSVPGGSGHQTDVPPPRDDLVAVFLTGVAGLNQPKNVKPAEMLRLNTSITATPPQSRSLPAGSCSARSTS